MKQAFYSVMLSLLLLTGCASNSHQDETNTQEVNVTTERVEERSDPLEGFNRAMFNFNYNVLDAYIVRPAAVFWRDYVPGPVRTGISNFSNNLSEPASMVNYLLQGDVKRSVKHLHRFLINTFFGVAGLVDVADHDDGLRREDNREFGNVLGHYGVAYGPYVHTPFYGSFTLREEGGGIVDSLYPPLYWLVGWPAVGKWLIDGIETRANYLDQDSLLSDSNDPYLVMRDAYFQNKDFLANDGKSVVKKNVNEAYIADSLDEIDDLD